MASVAFPSIAKKATLTDGTTYGYASVAPQRGNPTLLLLHGYPSSSYDWRHQIEYFSKEGYGLLVPDLLGYGDTSKPKELEAYAMRNIGRQVNELLDIEGLSTVVGIAHDWGCGLLSVMARWHNDRFSAFIFCSVGYLASSFRDIDAMNEATQQELGYPIFGYWKFHDQGDAGAVIDAHHDSYTSVLFPADPEIWKTIMCPIGEIRKFIEADKREPKPSWLTDEEIAMHNKILVGMGGHDAPLKWYKQAMRGLSAAEEEGLADKQRMIEKPLLYVRTEKDAICLPEVNQQNTGKFATNMQVASVDSTHWLMLEKPKETNEAFERFIGGLKV